MSSKLNELISRLKDPEFDDSAIYEAEDLIATVQEELAMNENLSDFDAMPGDELGGDELGDELGGEGLGGSESPVININAPLISIGSSNVSGGDGEDHLCAATARTEPGVGADHPAGRTAREPLRRDPDVQPAAA